MPPPSSETEHAAAGAVRPLCVRVAAGDEEAFRLFYTRWRPHVERCLRRNAGGAAETEDAVQEVFMRVITSLPPLETEAAVGAWLSTVSQRCAIDALRRGTRYERSKREARSTGDGEEHRRPDDLSRAHELLREAEGELRGMIEARVRFGWTLERVARAFGITASAVDGRINRQMAKYRRTLEEGNP